MASEQPQKLTLARNKVEAAIATHLKEYAGETRLDAIKAHAKTLTGQEPSTVAQAELVGLLWWCQAREDGVDISWDECASALVGVFGKGPERTALGRSALRDRFVAAAKLLDIQIPSSPRKLLFATAGEVVPAAVTTDVDTPSAASEPAVRADAPPIPLDAPTPPEGQLAAAVEPGGPPVRRDAAMVAIGLAAGLAVAVLLWMVRARDSAAPSVDPCLAYQGEWTMREPYRLDPDPNDQRSNPYYSRSRDVRFHAFCRVPRPGATADLVGSDVTYADVFTQGHEGVNDRVAETINIVNAVITFKDGVPVTRQMQDVVRLTPREFLDSPYYDRALLVDHLKKLEELKGSDCSAIGSPNEEEMTFHCVSNSQRFVYDKALMRSKLASR